MNLNEIFSGKFLIGCLIVISLLVLLDGMSISRNVGERVEKAKDILKEIQQSKEPELEKMESLVKIVMISGVRG